MLFTANNYIVIDIVNRGMMGNQSIEKYSKSRRVELIADELVRKLGCSAESRPFMCKVAYKLPESNIWQNYEAAQSASKSVIGLFIYLCKRDGV